MVLGCVYCSKKDVNYISNKVKKIKIKIWTVPYLGKNSILRTKIFFEKYDYIVILEKRNNYYQLVTAYVVDRKNRREDLLKEYTKYNS